MRAEENPQPEIHPQSLLFEITPRCNLDCRYCYNVWKDDCGYPVGELETDDIKRLLAKAIAESGVKQITITGGEPFLRDDLVEIIKFLSDMDIAVGLIANGAAGGEAEYQEAVRAGAGIVELPLQSSERDIHNRMVRGDAFDRATERLVDVKAAGGRTCAVIVLTKMNMHDVRETIKMAAALGADSVMINRFNVGGEGRNHVDELLPAPAELADALAEAEEAGKEWKLPVFSSVPVQPCLVDHDEFETMHFGNCPACT
ncbi:MAG: radical SAM protein, partial [Planctomycetes bacterium]|nr:radical SAM protein [Planctomycetota bacterium]